MVKLCNFYVMSDCIKIQKDIYVHQRSVQDFNECFLLNAYIAQYINFHAIIN